VEELFREYEPDELDLRNGEWRVWWD